MKSMHCSTVQSSPNKLHGDHPATTQLHIQLDQDKDKNRNKLKINCAQFRYAAVKGTRIMVLVSW